MTAPAPTKWNRFTILAEVHSRGMTLTGIALDAGYSESTCRKGLLGVSRKGAEAIATALGIPFRDLFPTMYSRGRHHENTKQKPSSRTSAKASLVLDRAGAAP